MNRRQWLVGFGAAAVGWTIGRVLSAGAIGPVSAADLTALGGEPCRSLPPEPLPPRGAGDLRYQGTHILTYGALRELATRFSQPGRRLIVAGGGCDDGIGAVKKGQAELGGMCCPVGGSRADGMGFLAIAQDYKAVVTHPDNRLSALSLVDLKVLARGRLVNWRELGGERQSIALVVRRHCPDYFEPVRELLLDGSSAWAKNALFVDTDEQIIDTVVRYPGAVGLVSWVFAAPLVARRALRVLAVEGRLPGEGRAYPLLGPLNLVFSSWNEPLMRPFFDFVYGPSGREVIARTLLPVSADEADYRRAVAV